MFYVGQKVVCVNAANNPGRVWAPGEALEGGRVYTVRSVHLDEENDLVVWLYEIARHPVAQNIYGPLAGYCIRRFRPLVERKTDISIFKALLNPKTAETV